MNPNLPSNETIEDGHVQLVAADALAAIERSQVDMQISTAKKYPRSVKAFLDESISMISLSPEIAEGCNYKLKRKNKDGGLTYIEGPSVRLLEIAASAYGNLRYGSRTIGIDDEFVTSQGVAFDMERNVASSVEVKRSIKGKFGRYSNDMIMITANAAGSIARRNALNGVIPRVYIQALSEHAKKVALGDIKTLPERRQRAFDYFTKTLGVPLEKVLTYLEKKSIEDCNLADVSDLQDLKTALKEGQSTVEDIFSDKPAQEAPKQKPPLEAKVPPPQQEKPLPPKEETKPKAKAETAPKPEKQGAPPKPEPVEMPPKEKPEAPPKPEPAAEAESAAVKSPPDLGKPPSVQQGLREFLDANGVDFDGFKHWLESSGRFRDAMAMDTIDQLPTEVCNALQADGGKALARCIKLHGKS